MASIQDDDTALVGSKAVNLARISRIGLSVPTGFCITGLAYREHISRSPVVSRLRVDLPKLERAQPDEKNRILSDIRQAIVEIPLSERLTEQIGAHYRELAAESVAVRSSATAEDLPGRSFAGQYDTYLGIADLVSCLDAIKKCWASLWTLRAYEYRQKNGFDHLKVNMAVMVQSLIPADAAGVVFTADPVTSRPDVMIVESCFGLGDALVSGKVTPDRFVLAKSSLKISSRTISEKRIEHVYDKHGAIQAQRIAPERASAPSIDETVIRKIAELAKVAEAEFGCPQDIEWAVHGGDIYLLQSRPITTLGRTQSPRDRWVWTNFLAQEVMPDVVTPITRSIIDHLGEVMFDPLLDVLCINRAGIPMYGYFAGRVYFHASFWAAVIRTLPGSRKYDFTKDIGSNSALAQMLEMFQSMTEDDLPKIKFSRVRFILKIPLLIAGILSCTPKKGQTILAETASMNERWQRLDVAGMSTEQITGCCAEIADAFHALLGNALYLFGTTTAYPGLQWVCAKWLSNVTYAGRLLAGVGNLDDAQAAMDLWQLAIKANELPELKKSILAGNSWYKIAAATSKLPQAKPFLEGWSDFMTRHGHHCRAEIELHNPRWSESSDYVLRLLRGYISCIDKADPLENREEVVRQRRSLEQRCRRQLRNPIKRKLFNHLLVRSRNAAVFRENIKSEIIKLLTTMRKLLVELGTRLCANKVLADPDDIFFLKMEEIGPVAGGRAEFDVKNVIAERRAEYDKWNSITPPDVIVGRFDPDDYVPEQVETDVDVLKGLAVSPGVATGKARVILRTDSDTQLEAGEVLVAPFTDPGWTPYFLPAVGIVMNQGSLLSHGAIVAREYGIPAVVNVGSATQIIKTGQTIEVDGNQGTIKILR